jgi:hypothetical protein
MTLAVAVGAEQVIQGFGLPAAIVIIALAGACLFLYKDNQKAKAERVSDLKEYSNKTFLMIESMQAASKSQLELSEKIYGILIDGKRR